MTPDMDLVVAFESLGHLTGHPDADQRRSQAAALIYAELERLAPRVGLRRERKDEVIQTVLVRLLAPGSHTETREHRRTVATVRSYLRTALSHARTDLQRAEQRLDRRRQPDGDEGPTAIDLLVDDGPLAGEQLVQRETEEEQAAEVEDLLERFETLAHRAAGEIRVQARQQAMLDAVHERLAIFHERSSIEEVVAAESQSEADFARVRARVYKRHQRALDRILDRLEVEEECGELSQEQALRLRRFMLMLRLRAPSVRSGRGASSSNQNPL